MGRANSLRRRNVYNLWPMEALGTGGATHQRHGEEPMAASGRPVDLRAIGILTIVYVAAAKCSLLLAVPPGYATAVWPPSGIAFAALLIAGTRVWPGVWLGAALTNLTVEGSPLLAVLIATGNTLEAVIGADLVRRYAGSGRFRNGEEVVKFAGAIGLAATVSAGVGVLALAVLRLNSWSQFLVNAWTWWQGDAVGMIVIAPFILSWYYAGRPRFTPPRVMEAAALTASVAVLCYFIFASDFGVGNPIPLTFVPLAFIVWAAIRFGARGVMTTALIVCALATWATLRGIGPWNPTSDNVALLVLLAYASTLVITGLALATVTEERERVLAKLREGNALLARRVAERTRRLEDAIGVLRGELLRREHYEEVLRENEERFRLLVEGVKDYAIYGLDPDGRIVSWNAGAEQIKGYTASEIIGSHLSRFYTSEDIARGWPDHALEVARAEGRFEDEGWRMRKDGTRFWASVLLTALRDPDGRLRGFVKITRDLTARRHVEALQETDRRLREFLAMLAHELRNPLSAIVNAQELMRYSPGADHSDLRVVVDRQVALLARIVDDLLDVSRITRGKIELRRETLDLGEAVTRVVESFRPSIDARGHRVAMRLPPGPIPVDADPTRLAQIVQNLLGNAVKYTPRGGCITIEVALDKDCAVLRVRDDGIGIPADLLPNVFELFVQGERALDRADAGLGIGLTLVKRLTEMHGGSVSASSRGPGAGSEFTTRLPLSNAPLAHGATADAAATAPDARHRLLVVDDNRDSANSLAALLEAMGHEVRTAYDGPGALSVASDFRPRAAFVDIGLPGMDGYEVARRLRACPELAPVTLVAFTGYCQDEDRQRVLEAGFDHHVAKPARLSELARIVGGLPAPAPPSPHGTVHARPDTG